MKLDSFREHFLDVRTMIIKISLYIVLILLLYVPMMSVFSASVLLFVIPGLCVASHLLNEKEWDWFEVAIVSVIVGFCIQPILGYALSIVKVRFLEPNFLLITSLIFLVLTKRPKFKFPKNVVVPTSLIAMFFLNFIIFATPTYDIGRIAMEEVGPFPTGDDSKLHTLLIDEILSNEMIPQKLRLYPKIQRVRYSMGYHLIISEILSLTKMNMFHLMFFFAPFLASLFSLSCYVLGKKMFSERVGLICAVLSFAILPILKFVTFGMYPNLLGVVIQPVSILFIYYFVKQKGIGGPSILAPLLLVGLLEINLYPFLINSMIALTLALWHRKRVTMFITLSVLIALPYLIVLFGPVHFSSSSSLCLTFEDLQKLGLKHSVFSEKIEYFFYSNQHLLMNIGLASLAMIGVSYLTKLERKIFIAWIVVIFLIIAKRYIPIPSVNNYIWYFFNSFWFWLEDQRLFYHLWVPIVFLASVFIDKMGTSKVIVTLILLIFIIPALAIKMYRPSELRYQSFTKGDYEYVYWVDENVSKDSLIYNDGFGGTATSWIPPLTNTKVVFPFLSSDLGLATLGGSYREDMKIIRQVPDSPQAMDILKRYNATHVTFSTFFRQYDWFGRELPEFNLDRFVGPCYTRLYGAHENWVFKINHDCDPDGYINLMKFNLVVENFIINNGTDVRRIGPIKNETGATINHLFDQNLLFDLDRVLVEPGVVRDSQVFLFVYYTADKIGNSTASIVYGIEDKHSFLQYDIFQFKSCSDVVSVVEVPPDFVLEKDPVVWFKGEPLSVKKVVVAIRMPNTKKISDKVYLQGAWRSGEESLIIDAGSLDSRILLQVDEPGNLTIEYVDAGKGNVDLNYYDETWKPFDVIRRSDSGVIKSIKLNMDSKIQLFGINVYPHGEDFEIKDMYFG